MVAPFAGFLLLLSRVSLKKGAGNLKGIQSPKNISTYTVAYDEIDPMKKGLGTIMCSNDRAMEYGGIIQWIQAVYFK